LGEEGDAMGEVGEYFGDDGDIWAGAAVTVNGSRISQIVKLTS
jgi:hypothetical protein